MKQLLLVLGIGIILMSCGSSPKTTAQPERDLEEAVVISNDSLEYEIIIYDIGFNTYLSSIAQPAEFYSQQYYEQKNLFYVTEWNIRARNPIQYGDFYAMEINYEQNIDYGLDVNYKLFNYFRFCEDRYGIRFSITRG